MQPAARAETKVRSSAFHNVSRFQTNGRAPGGAWGTRGDGPGMARRRNRIAAAPGAAAIFPPGNLMT